ncbi:MAG: AraC family transcriptional regulator [Spirochaetales bacterium]|nr:AraC family transcriptional regulator [Spirochaetales bacterium]
MVLEVTDLQIYHGYLSEEYPEHSHRFWEIHWITRGQGRLIQDDQTYELSSGVLLLSPPGCRHTLEVKDPLHFLYLWFDASGAIEGHLTSIWENQRTTGFGFSITRRQSPLTSVKKKIDSAIPALELAGLHEFLSFLFTLPAPAPAGLGPRLPSFESQRITMARGFIESRIHEPLTLGQVADTIGMNMYVFAREFRRLTGTSAMEYHRRVRVEASKYYLATTTNTLADIAATLGFCDQFHFSKTFLRYTGLSPSAFRRNTQG